MPAPPTAGSAAAVRLATAKFSKNLSRSQSTPTVNLARPASNSQQQPQLHESGYSNRTDAATSGKKHNSLTSSIGKNSMTGENNDNSGGNGGGSRNTLSSVDVS